MPYDLYQRRARALQNRLKPFVHPVSGEALRIVTAVSHMHEVTLGLSLRSLDRQTVGTFGRRVVARVGPTHASLNAALDFANEQQADLLFHTASDVIAEPDALERLVECMDMTNHYLAVGRGYDMLNGSGSACGLSVFNMRIIGNSFRSRDVYMQDLDLCTRVEDATGTSRIYANGDDDLGYHHPIWTAEELYLRLRYSAPKYTDVKRQQYRSWLSEQLLWNPNNAVLHAGVRALDNAEDDRPPVGSKNSATMHAVFVRETSDLGIRGQEFYVHHSLYKDLARRLLQSSSDCVAVDERGELHGQD
jgi:hypothetical protein